MVYGGAWVGPVGHRVIMVLNSRNIFKNSDKNKKITRRTTTSERNKFLQVIAGFRYEKIHITSNVHIGIRANDVTVQLMTA